MTFNSYRHEELTQTTHQIFNLETPLGLRSWTHQALLQTIFVGPMEDWVTKDRCIFVGFFTTDTRTDHGTHRVIYTCIHLCYILRNWNLESGLVYSSL